MSTTAKTKASYALTESIIKGIREKKGKNIVLIDMSTFDDAICKYMVIAEGNTPIQVEAIEESVFDTVLKELRDKPVRTHKGTGEWIAMDYVDVMVHLFVPQVRQFYNLELLWADAKVTKLDDEE